MVVDNLQKLLADKSERVQCSAAVTLLAIGASNERVSLFLLEHFTTFLHFRTAVNDFVSFLCYYVDFKMRLSLLILSYTVIVRSPIIMPGFKAIHRPISQC